MMSSILSYLKKILILTFINLIIVVLVYLIKKQFTLYNVGYGLSIGGIVMCILGALALMGFGNIANIDARNTYAARYDGEKFGRQYIKERNKNRSFTLLMLLSGLFSLILGYLIR
ncbi:hypothetical protein [Clostridium omnivorum]|uniref:DUF3899 domain-containing protein n=1 Tax=Clostridium omnivorum TaxID=1604902 RepID=A0ABQ5N4F3_9CLOT|nr:hypothetical protein [Clostridium sp. E14]GLC30097.1 hypothetical protein bsdE14_15070 [Clostridium sp. E14]